MKRKILSIAIILILTFFLSSCSKDDDNPVTPEEKPSPEQPATPQVQLPPSVSNSNDPHAARAVSFVAMANSFSQYSAFFTPPEGSLAKTADDGNWDYTWTDGTLVITLHYRENGEGYSWEVVLNGTEPSSGVVYTDWTMMEAQQNSDGSSGSMTVYEDNTTNPEFEYTWTNDGSGHITFEYISFGDYGSKVSITSNPDNSGSMEYCEYVNGQYVMTFKLIWTSNGGEWWEYDYQGNEIGHGTF